MSPSDIAALLAREKALVVSARKPGRYVVGADQTLALGERLFNKPAGRAQALTQLQALAGQTPRTAFRGTRSRATARSCSNTSPIAGLTMRPLRESEIAAYLDEAGDAVTSSVGAYQLEGLGVHLFDRIEGDHFTILGLPLLPLLGFLRGERLLAI